MGTVETIQSGLIDKILAIHNKEFLLALDELILSNTKSEPVELTAEQKLLLEMSEQDIRDNKTISQEEMTKRNLEWLNAM